MKRLAVFCRDTYKEYILNTFASSTQLRFRLEFFVEGMDYFYEETWETVQKNLADGWGETFDAVLLVEEHDTFIERSLAILRKADIADIYIIKIYTCTKKIPFLDNDGLRTDRFLHITSWDKPFIPYLEAHVTDYCNLNCKACFHYSPFYCKDEGASLLEFKKDLSRIKQLFSQVGRLCLLGGEPLLDPELCMAFIRETRNQLPNTEIKLTTNGLLIPRMQDSFWQCVRENCAVIYVTQYKPTSAMLDTIEQTLQQQNVDYIISDKITYFAKNVTPKPYENAKKQWLLCTLSGCHNLRNGVIARCPYALYIKAFDKIFSTNIYADDGVNIYAQEDGTLLLDQLMAPCKMCASCAVDRLEYIPWEVCGKEPDKNDWLIDDRTTYMEKKMDYLLQTQMLPHMEKQFVCFGGGEGYKRLKRRLSKLVTVAYVCSNDTKEDHPREDGTQEITVAHLQAMDNPAVLITVDKPEFRQQIEAQLTEMGITRYMVADDFLSAIENN